MSVLGTLSPDGTVQLHCPRPGCTATLKVKPKKNRTAVTCAADGCGHRFVLEVAGLDNPPSGETPAPPPLAAPPLPAKEPPAPVKETFSFMAEDEPSRDPPKPVRPKREMPRSRNRRDEEETKSGGSKVALLVGGVIVAFLLLAGGVTAVVIYATRSKDTTPTNNGAVAQNHPAIQQPIAVPPFEAVKPKYEPGPSIKPKTPTPVFKLETAPNKDEPADAPTPGAPITEPEKPTATPDEAAPPKKGPPKKGRPGTEPTPRLGPAKEFTGDSKTVIDRVKKSTALIELKGGWGTGFVIKPGIVMTNFHVINGAMLEDLKVSFVTLDDTAPTALKPTLLFCDPRRDLGILRVETDRPPLEFCPSGTDLQGLAVAVVGNPRGDGGQAMINRVTTGKVAAPVRRNAEWTYFELQAEAFFGNSGGPVVDLKTGKLVGVMQSILGDGKAKSYCIPYGEAMRALERLPASKEKEPEAIRLAAGRHYLEYVKTKLPVIERNAAVAMKLQLAILDNQGFAVGVIFDNGEQFTAAEVMSELKETHAKTHAQLSKLVSGPISSSPEVPSALRSAARLRLETCGSMRDLAGAKTETKNAFVKAMETRKAANDRNIKTFEEEYAKFLEKMDKAKAN